MTQIHRYTYPYVKSQIPDVRWDAREGDQKSIYLDVNDYFWKMEIGVIFYTILFPMFLY